ncbi:1-deoxy-D-xylulose-5-phosphate reductoisomerase [Marininema halotolerans]|uniref:1-deoxy-D-xylulose 5-phosphate reductoisomerase n=1 Tax=Marininema halotolerans TaxID=1155944 RepID=A0A1I6QPX6_9BACL|nr:1-deoxy-D-xylulose-5-phosphate reductoisomerase [Marininema halotolerans]SFS54531.1 1-deoxy-D-xylulose-5-phosphate reductoisomerase [Marininema halotolerans]
MKRITILGSTGSIGISTLEVIRQHPSRFKVEGMAAGKNVEEMIRQAEEFRPRMISMEEETAAEAVRKGVSYPVEVVWGSEGLLSLATLPEADYVVSAIVGSRGLPPTLAAIHAGKTIGLANKESLVMGGALVMEAAREHGVSILPIDSEHSALFQSMNGEPRERIRRILVTASGGSFRDWPRERLATATKEQALKHPNWSMGAKVTIDSATLMNKGLEVIEARWLFDLPYDQIDVLIHPESIIHSLVEYEDGAIMAQLGTPDMKVPIQYALSYPERLPLKGEPLDLVAIGKLHFRAPDFDRFPCLKLAYTCGRQGGTLPTVMNAANEIAVEHFLAGKLTFLGIEEVLEEVLSRHTSVQQPTLDDLFEADRWARDMARKCGARVGTSFS